MKMSPTTVANAGGEDEYEGGTCLLAAVSSGVLGLDVGWVRLGPALSWSLGLGEERIGSMSKGSAYTADNPTIGQYKSLPGNQRPLTGQEKEYGLIPPAKIWRPFKGTRARPGKERRDN